MGIPLSVLKVKSHFSGSIELFKNAGVPLFNVFLSSLVEGVFSGSFVGD